MSRTVFITLLIVFSLLSSFAAAKDHQLTLSQFLNEVRKSSPEFVIEKANIETARARADGIRIEPPMIGYMQMKEGNTITNGFEISQNIPFPTKISQNKKVLELELESQKESSELQEISLLADARSAYVSLWSAYARLEIQKERLNWLRHHVKITRSSAWSNTDAKIHLLEIESDADLAENDMLSLEADLVDRRNALRVYAPELNAENIVPIEPEALLIKLEKVSSSPLVKLKEKELKAKEAFESSQKQNYIPDFYLRLRSFEAKENMPRSQEVMIGISLPFLYFWQPQADASAASAQKMKAQAELRKSRIDFEGKLLSLAKKNESTLAQLNNLKEKLIPRAERRTKLVRNISQRTMEGLDQHKEVMLALLELKTKAIELRLTSEEVTRDLLKLTGTNDQQGLSK